MNLYIGRLKQRATELTSKGKQDRTDILPDDILQLDDKFNQIRLAYEQLNKNLEDLGYSKRNTPFDKRLPKIPNDRIGHSMKRCGECIGDGDLGSAFSMCGVAQHNIAKTQAKFENDISESIIEAIQELIDNEFKNLQDLRRKLDSSRIDVDAIKNRISSSSTAGSNDRIQEQLDDAEATFEQSKHNYIDKLTEFMCREDELVAQLIKFMEIQNQFYQHLFEQTTLQLEELKSLQGPKLFGHSLQEWTEQTGQKIPTIVEQCIYGIDPYMEEQGIFRMSGEFKVVRKLRNLFNRQTRFDIRSPEYFKSPHDICGILKLYFRELPDPLLVASFYDRWIETHEEQDHNERLYKMKDLLDELPENNLATLKCLIRFLEKVTHSEKTNKMAASNLGIVFGPTLIRKAGDSDMMDELKVSHCLAGVVEYMILYYSWLFDDDSNTDTVNYIYFDPTAPIESPASSPQISRRITSGSGPSTTPPTPLQKVNSGPALGSPHRAHNTVNIGITTPSSAELITTKPLGTAASRPTIPKRGAAAVTNTTSPTVRRSNTTQGGPKVPSRPNSYHEASAPSAPSKIQRSTSGDSPTPQVAPRRPAPGTGTSPNIPSRPHIPNRPRPC